MHNGCNLGIFHPGCWPFFRRLDANLMSDTGNIPALHFLRETRKSTANGGAGREDANSSTAGEYGAGIFFSLSFWGGHWEFDVRLHRHRHRRYTCFAQRSWRIANIQGQRSKVKVTL